MNTGFRDGPLRQPVCLTLRTGEEILMTTRAQLMWVACLAFGSYWLMLEGVEGWDTVPSL